MDFSSQDGTQHHHRIVHRFIKESACCWLLSGLDYFLLHLKAERRSTPIYFLKYCILYTFLEGLEILDYGLLHLVYYSHRLNR